MRKCGEGSNPSFSANRNLIRTLVLGWVTVKFNNKEDFLNVCTKDFFVDFYKVAYLFISSCNWCNSYNSLVYKRYWIRMHTIRIKNNSLLIIAILIGFHCSKCRTGFSFCPFHLISSFALLTLCQERPNLNTFQVRFYFYCN